MGNHPSFENHKEVFIFLIFFLITVGISGGPATNKDTVATANTTNEIVAGKFSENEWNLLLQDEEHESFCAGVLEELLQKTMDQCHQKYIERQLRPFTVECAKQALLEIVELRFLEKDFGEAETSFDSCWVEDEEPDFVLLDSWAAGAVPCSVVASEVPETATQSERSVKGLEVPEPIEEQVEIAENEQIDEEIVDIEEKTISQELPDDKVAKKEEAEKAKPRRRKYKPYRGPIRSAGVSKMSETLFETELRLNILEQVAADVNTSREMPAKMQQAMKAQAGRPPGLGDVPVKDIKVVLIDDDHRGSLEHVPPTIQVRTNYMIIDPEVEAAQQRLIAMRTGRFNPINMVAPKKKAEVKDRRQTQEFKNEQQLTYERAASNGVAPVPPPLIESMDVAPGVTVREGGRVKQGPKRLQKQSSSSKLFSESMLQPVNKSKMKQTISVSEIISPYVTKTNKPLPPIA